MEFDFPRPSSTLDIDRKPSYFDDVTLDSGILDDAPTMMSPTNSTTGFFSPTDSSLWDDNFSNPFPERRDMVPQVSTHTMFDQSNNNNPFMRMPPNQAATYGQQPSAWPMETSSGSRTPTATTIGAFGHEFEHSQPSFIPTQSMFGGLPSSNNVRPSSIFPPTQQDTPMSPHSNEDWMNLAAQEREQHQRQGTKRMRPNTPPRAMSPFQRPGGIRKKNTRFEIPAERSLGNIDQLIAQSTNEEEIKELKQQKRLLRNRQAALDSRQRKKKHTEELEKEKKLWTEQMTELEEQCANLRMACENIARERDEAQLKAQRIIDNLQWDKEELVRNHTLETGELRKKITLLTEKLEQQSGTAMSVAPSSTFADFASDMGNLTMGGTEWGDADNYVFLDEFCNTQELQQQEQQPSNTLVVASRPKDVSEDKPVASGLLLMLLLCGAFVASKSSGSTAPPLPKMPEDVRAASATVLDSIFKDAGVSPSTTSTAAFIANRVQGLEPAASGAVNWNKHGTLSGAEFASLTNGGSTLDQQFNQLVNPSKEQELEDAFSMTASQYNSLTSADFSRRAYNVGNDDAEPLSPGSQPSHRRNLAETLAAMRAENKGESAADVYTRSLLWERIPTEVVREFKRMVEESDRLTTENGEKVKNEVSS